MKKSNILALIGSLALVGSVAVAPVSSVSAYTVNRTYYAQRSTQKTSARYIIAHETGDVAPAINNAIYMNREWRSVQAYTAYVVGDGGRVYQVSPEGYVQWGAGSVANSRSPVQIELARTNNRAQFNKDYPVYVNLIRDSAKRWGIPLTLDGAGNGVKSHLWVTQNLWGNHSDPYGYLSQWGVSKQQFAANLQTGLKENGSNVAPQPAPSKPTTSAGLTVDGDWGKATTRALQRIYGTYNDGIVSSQYPWRNFYGRVYSFQYSYYPAGSRLIAAMQRRLGVYADGKLGPATIRAMQRKLGTPVDGSISYHSLMVRAMQRKLNSGVAPF